MSRILTLAGNGILRQGKTSKRHVCNRQREESRYHRDTMLRGGLSVRFLKPGGICIPPRLKGSSGIQLILGREDVRDRSGKMVGFQRMPCISAAGILHPDTPALTLPSGTSKLCGNDMIDAHVENLMDSKAAHRFTTVAWKSLRLSHNHLDKCFAFTHIPTRPTTTNLISHKN